MSTKKPYFMLDLRSALGGDESVELVPQKRRRSRPRVGDFFAIHVRDHGWLIGRVVMESPAQLPGESQTPFGGTYLVYVYKGFHRELPTELPNPAVPRLILPPMIVGRELWTMGDVCPLGNRPFAANEVLEKHCFYHTPSSMVHDEFGNILSAVSLPCGESSLFLAEGLRQWLARSLRDGFDQDKHPLR